MTYDPLEAIRNEIADLERQKNKLSELAGRLTLSIGNLRLAEKALAEDDTETLGEGSE
jgi:hypothetical protein